MYAISDEQIDFILDDLKKNGIGLESLRLDLLDHICIVIEQTLDDDGDFYRCYRETITTFYKQELIEIEEATLFLLNSKGPRLVIGKNIFFGILFLVSAGPFVTYDLVWFLQTNHLPLEIWGATLVYSLFPNLINVVLLLTPKEFDPLIPRDSKIVLGIKPIIRIFSSTK